MTAHLPATKGAKDSVSTQYLMTWQNGGSGRGLRDLSIVIEGLYTTNDESAKGLLCLHEINRIILKYLRYVG